LTLRIAQGEIVVQTRGPGLVEVTREVSRWLAEQGISAGQLTVFIRHTSASLTIQENADPSVLDDLERFFSTVVPQERGRYRHSTEGPDDMPAHIRSALTQVQLTIPIVDGRMALGTWQGIYVFEHRARPHARRLVLQALGA
jgi:secondary thiamine-phosphate synthase enzyme